MYSISRLIEKNVKEDLDSKIVLISGPRQCGKTTLSKKIYESYDYLNYDKAEDRYLFIKGAWRKDVDLVILDEIHKHIDWKRYLKGIYDTQGVRPRLLVTGSAKMDTYRKVGDSLAGRYFRHRLYPFDVKELVLSGYSNDLESVVDQLLVTGGFPEPFLKGVETYYKKWRKTHLDIILRQDLFDLEHINHIQSIELLIQLLKKRVGSPISYASLANDLQHSPITIKRWLTILEQLYVVFSVRPYHRNVAQAILKAPKYYFYDIGLVEDAGARLENLVAVSLLKNLHLDEDSKGDDVALNFIQTKQGKEVDFCVVRNDELHLVEVKQSDDTISKNLLYFHHKLSPTSSVQVMRHLKREKHYPNGIRVVDLNAWLTRL